MFKINFTLVVLVIVGLHHFYFQAVNAQFSKFINCPTKIGSALIGTCKTKLDERLETVDKAEKDIDEVAPSMFRCCYFAEYVHCVAEEAKPDCGENVSKEVEEKVNKMFSTISGKCQDYNINNPKCIFVVWFNLIISFLLVGIIMLIGCCIGSCFCKNKM